MISVRGLRVDYEQTTAVWDLDLEIRPGEVYGLVGPNGAGKTSTIKAISGMIDATYGDIHIAGADVALYPEQAWKHLGYMPDFPPVYENLRVWEYLDVFAAAHLIPRRERSNRVHHWLEQVHLHDEWNTRVGDLSRGMCQRLVLAKTLLHEPKVLLLDEPASGMDPAARVQLRGILRDVARNGAAVLISSHILSELGDMCTSIGVMDRGRMVVSGSLDEIRERCGMTGRLIVRMASPSETAHGIVEKCLNAYHAVQDARRGPDAAWTGAFTGDDAEAATLLATLVTAGAPIAEFRVRKEGIEDIFMRVSAGEEK